MFAGSTVSSVLIKRLQVCGSIAQPNEQVSQLIIVCFKEKASRLILKL